MKKVSVIIVNYNTKDILRECLSNLKTLSDNLEVIVIDNGSSDGSFEMLKREFKWVKAVKEENKGISYGYNRGVEQATGNYYLFLGSDAFPSKGSIQGIVEYMEEYTKVGIATAQLILEDGTLDIDGHRGFPTPWASLTHFSGINKIFPKSKVFNQYFLGYKNMSVVHEIDLCISHFMMVRKEVFNDVKSWDEDFFVFGEDVDFCYRVKKAGWKIIYLPQFKVKHLKGVSVGIRKSSSKISGASLETKKRMKTMTTQAMKLFYKKHYERRYPWVVNKLVYIGISMVEFLRTK